MQYIYFSYVLNIITFSFTQEIFIECLLLPGTIPNAGDKAERTRFLYITDFKMHIFSHFSISEISVCLTIYYVS